MGGGSVGGLAALGALPEFAAVAVPDDDSGAVGGVVRVGGAQAEVSCGVDQGGFFEGVAGRRF